MTAHESVEHLSEVLAGRYSVEREIAAGGMATVYLAHDLKHRRKVALKLMRASAAEGGTQRFLREIGLTARLSHPHILPLLDSGDVDGMPYYVMPFVDGETLRDRILREQRLPLADAIHFAAEVADALAYAHAQGVIHRDIKPANILLSRRHAIVADFGVAKALTTAAGSEEPTQAGLAIGTVAYMSPEQAVGDVLIDARTDIFSLGIVLYEMLTGETAFGGATMQEQLARRFTGIVPSARERRVEVPADVDEVLARALATHPSNRFASAGELEEALLRAARSGGTPGSFLTGAIHVARQPDAAPSVAVLPFDNLSGDVENDYLSDGITEDILTQLSLRRTIKVCARMSSFAFRKTTESVRDIGAKLGVRHLLTGGVRRAGDRLRVTAQLVDVQTGFQTWSERYDRLLADVFAIQDEIGAAIATALNATLLGDLTAPSSTVAPRIDVYEAFLRGRFLWNRRTADSTRRAIDSFHAALALDPGYAPALAGLANAWVTLGVYGIAAPEQAMPQARQAAEAALLLDPAQAEARTALAQVVAAHSWDWDSADAMFRQAIALHPQSPVARQGHAIMCLTPLGRHDEAAEQITRAIALDPLSAVMRVTLSSARLYARQYEGARDAARVVLDLEPAFAPAHFFLAQALLELGDGEGALRHAVLAVEQSGESSESLAAQAFVCARLGQLERAREIARQLGERSTTQYVSPSQRAMVHVALGDHEMALNLLDEAAEVRAADLVWVGVRPGFDPLHGTPRFRALLERMGLPPAP